MKDMSVQHDALHVTVNRLKLASGIQCYNLATIVMQENYFVTKCLLPLFLIQNSVFTMYDALLTK